MAENPPAGAVAVPVRQTWNNPPINRWRILAAFYSFIVLGESIYLYLEAMGLVGRGLNYGEFCWLTWMVCVCGKV